jgi:hypothetical protein
MLSLKYVYLVNKHFSLNKQASLNCSKIYTILYAFGLEHVEQYELLRQVQILHCLKTKIS